MSIVDESAIKPPRKAYENEEYLRRLSRSIDLAVDTMANLENNTDLIPSDGAVAGTNVTVQEKGNSALNKSIITFTSELFAITDQPSVVAYAGQKFYDFPEGIILIHGAVANLTIGKDAAGVDDDFDGDFSIGTVTAGNDATLTSTEANIIASTAMPQATTGSTTAKGHATGSEVPLILDGTTTAIDAYLNFLIDDADHDVSTTPTNLIVTGTVNLFWSLLGDY